MKKTLHMIAALILFCFYITGSMAQTLSPEVISAGGNSQIIQGQNSLNWTMGEAIIGSLSNPSNTLILTQGFHQTNLIVVNTFEVNETDFECKVFPNPTSDWINIETSATKTLRLELIDLRGQVLKSQFFYQNFQLHLRDFPGSLYMLRLFEDSIPFMEIKFIKI